MIKSWGKVIGYTHVTSKYLLCFRQSRPYHRSPDSKYESSDMRQWLSLADATVINNTLQGSRTKRPHFPQVIGLLLPNASGCPVR
jgi:hypothetical protein